MKPIKFLNVALISALLLGFSSCDKEDEPGVENPNNGDVPPVEEPTDSVLTTEEKVIDLFSSIKYDEMLYVEGGTFTMGATEEQGKKDPYSDEYPIHQVKLDDFYIGKYEVTQSLWKYVMNYSGLAADSTEISALPDEWVDGIPSIEFGRGDCYPVYLVSYKSIVETFIPRLNKITGKSFRLPTEAEWEYAARGGNKSQGYKYSGSNVVDDVAWYVVNAKDVGVQTPDYGTHEVGKKAPNELGICDMSGNVMEWCSDWYAHGYYSSSPSENPTGPVSDPYSKRVCRGGSWNGYAKSCRVSCRLGYAPDGYYIFVGFRLVCSDL